MDEYITARVMSLFDSGPSGKMRLDGNSVRNLMQQIRLCTTRDRLDDLTREIWRTYDGPEEPLEQLKSRILAQRAIVDRNDPR